MPAGRVGRAQLTSSARNAIAASSAFTELKICASRHIRGLSGGIGFISGSSVEFGWSVRSKVPSGAGYRFPPAKRAASVGGLQRVE